MVMKPGQLDIAKVRYYMVKRFRNKKLEKNRKCELRQKEDFNEVVAY